jgi:DNA-binding beta-propeller fold protein YncE
MTMKTIIKKATRYLLPAIALLCLLPAGTSAADKKTSASASSQQLIWPLPPDKPRVKFLQELASNLDVEPRKKKSWVDKMVGNPDPNRVQLFDKPTGIAVDSRGRIIFASTQHSTVFIVDQEAKSIVRVRGDRGIVLQTPLGVVVDGHDNIFVSDPLQHMILKFDTNGHLQATIGSGKDGVKNPTFMAIDEARRRLYVVDSHLHQVLVFNLDNLQLTKRVGTRGESNGEFNFPVGIAIGPDGSFAVTDTGSCSVQVFTADYKFVRRFGRQGDRPGEFIRPKGIAIDKEGNYWVVDAAFNNFQIFNPQGTLLMWVGQFGNVPGAFNLPMGIYIDKNQKVYVSDQLNHRLQIFQFLGGN